MSTYSRYRRWIGDTVNNGVAWKTPSCICSCQWCIKSEVFCSNCWMQRRRLEASSCDGLPARPAIWRKMLFLFELLCFLYISNKPRSQRESCLFSTSDWSLTVSWLGSGISIFISPCSSTPALVCPYQYGNTILISSSQSHNLQCLMPISFNIFRHSFPSWSVGLCVASISLSNSRT